MLTTALACFTQVIYGVLILRGLRQTPDLPMTAKVVVASGFFAALFSTTQVNNFLYAMDMQWYLSNGFALSAFSVLVAQQRVGWFLVLGTLAAMCNFTGLLCLPIGIVWLWLTHPKTAQQHSYSTILVLVLVFFYVRNPHNEQHIVWVSLQQASNAMDLAKLFIGTAIKMIRYVALYLSSPLSRSWPWLGGVLSIGGIVLCTHYWIRQWQGKQLLSPWQQLCLLLASSIILSAIATAYGRMIYPNSATAERYQTLVLPFWPAIIGLTLPDCARLRLGLCCAMALMLLLLAPAQMPAAVSMADLSNRVQLAHTAARADVTGLRYVSATLSYPLLQHNINQVANMNAFLRTQHLGYFLSPSVGQINDSTPNANPLPDCQLRYQETLKRDDSGSEMRFVSRTDDAPQPLQLQLLQLEQPIGLGQALRPAGWLLPLAWLPAHQREFAVFSPLHQGSDPLQLVGWLAGKPICQQSVRLSK